MTTYRVTFFKNLVNSNGHQFKCQQGMVEIHCARNRERALEAAQRRYERAKNVGNWTIYADIAELEAIETDGSSEHFVEPASRAPVWRREKGRGAVYLPA
jgi:hypothetical protein